MKNWLLPLLLFAVSPLVAQSTIYEGFEVDSAAMPRGGITAFNTFLVANLRKPILAESKGTGGVVVLSSIIEIDGHVSNVAIRKSLRPDCDREAIRVLELFNAWKPAQKEGKAVRQQISMSIVFKPNAPFPYQNGVRVNYFDVDHKPVVDSSLAVYRQLTPIDTSGLPTGDIVLYKLKGTSWKKDGRLSFVRKTKPSRKPAEPSVQLIGYQNENQQWEGQQFSLTNTGMRISQSFYQKGKRVGPEINYYPNGSIAQKIDDFDDKMVSAVWYPNGQIKQVSVETKTNFSTHDNMGQYIKLNSPTQFY